MPVVGASMEPVVTMLRMFADLEETLLLRGPTGTGKSHLARWCHAQSPRSQAPFVVVHLHALPDGLREGELFGWRRGAFTGATRDHAGAVQRAEGGTLFIDEVDKLPLSTQAGLLRLIEDRRYQAMGEGRERAANVRVMVGTNAPLEAEVAAGRFLEDLYYRVHVLPVEVPPLVDRLDELREWANLALEGTGAHVSDEAEAALCAFGWPGNLRQLRSVVVRAYAFARGQGAGLIREPHVRRALAMEAPLAPECTLSGLRRAAEAFVSESAARATTGRGPLDCELAEAFTGLVLEAAIARFGGEREAFLHFGLEDRLKGGNHLKTWRRERERIARLTAALSPPNVPTGRR